MSLGDVAPQFSGRIHPELLVEGKQRTQMLGTEELGAVTAWRSG